MGEKWEGSKEHKPKVKYFKQYDSWRCWSSLQGTYPQVGKTLEQAVDMWYRLNKHVYKKPKVYGVRGDGKA